MTDLEQWLKARGLEKYSRVFAENDLDVDGLADLSEGDLTRLGLSLGHRRKLMRELVARRRATANGALSASQDSSSAPDAERRQITVLFCDLVGSTELASALDPEDASAIIRRYQDACAGAVARFDGYVAKFMGDGLLAYFGYPQANEDATLHAIRAALAIVDAVGELKHPAGRALEVRIGIATGVVVLGDLIGTGSARERSIAGETPNLAARLQALAEPNAIIVGHRTYQLLGGQFEYEGLGMRALKGFAAPVPVWRVLRETAALTRFAATRAANRGTFVGRGAESSLLVDHWRRAAQGQGHAVLISGEAGMGKSRLSDMLSEHIGNEHCYRVTCQCSPYHTNSALYPVIRQLERAAGFAEGDSDAQKLAKLEVLLRGAGETPAAPAPALIASLLSLPTDRYPAIELSPPQRKSATLAALIDLLTLLAADAPVLLLLEDAHWIDPTTRELWTQLIDRIATTRLLALVTARPEFASPWTGRTQISSLDLARLTSAESAELVADIASPRALEPALVDDIVAKGDGVPLYVEELTRTVLESPELDRPAVPATLHDSLMARLDRLGPAKEIAQVAAVIGQQFSHALLAAIVSCSAADLAASLRRLEEAGLAYRRGPEAAASYSFKHALLRDVAYENLLRARRALLHERIGTTLIERFASIAESEPELLAHHFHCAGLHDLACTYRERAGDRAMARSSFAEAIAHFNAGLAEAGKLDAGPQRTRRELELLLKAGPPLASVKSPQSPDVADIYQRAHDHAKALQDDTELFKATWGLWFNTIQGRWLDRARDHAQALVILAGRTGNDDLMLEGMHCRWSTAQFRGDVATALEDTREGINRYDREKHRWLGPVFGGHDPGVCAHSCRCNALMLEGRPGEAWQCIAQAVSLAEELKHPGSLAHAVMNGTIGALLGGDHREADRYSQRLLELANKYNLPPFRAHALFLSGWAQAFTTDFDAGLAAMEAAFSPAFSTGPLFRCYAAVLAESREKDGRFADALNILASAIATISEPGIGLYISELYRLKGTCLLHADPAQAGEAMRSLRTAVDIARCQGATVLELKAAVSLAKAAIVTGPSDADLGPLRGLLRRLPPEFAAPGLAEATRVLAD